MPPDAAAENLSVCVVRFVVRATADQRVAVRSAAPSCALIPSGDKIDSRACASRRGGRRPVIHVFADRSARKTWMPTFVGTTMRAASVCQRQSGLE
jgi:hypothetical protein